MMGFFQHLLAPRKPVAPHDSADGGCYWEQRKDVLYYQVVKILAAHIGKHAKSMLDVGSAGCPYLDWFRFIPHRSSLDLKTPYVADDVRSFVANFLDWQPDRHYDLVLCLQVLEHVPNANAFAKKLLSTGSVVLISVPYKWEKGRTKSHVHDPVDEEKLLTWFQRPPNFQYICREVKVPLERLIQVYEPFDEPWVGLNARDKLLQNRRA